MKLEQCGNAVLRYKRRYLREIKRRVWRNKIGEQSDEREKDVSMQNVRRRKEKAVMFNIL